MIVDLLSCIALVCGLSVPTASDSISTLSDSSISRLSDSSVSSSSSESTYETFDFNVRFNESTSVYYFNVDNKSYNAYCSFTINVSCNVLNGEIISSYVKSVTTYLNFYNLKGTGEYINGFTNQFSFNCNVNTESFEDEWGLYFNTSSSSLSLRFLDPVNSGPLFTKSYAGSFVDNKEMYIDLSTQFFNQLLLVINTFESSYIVGYDCAISLNDTTMTIFNGILSVALLPINMFLEFFNFSILGINISSFVSALLTLACVIMLIRLIVGGKASND